MNGAISPTEDLLRDELINKIAVVSAYLAVTAYVSAQLRAFDIGLTYRDILQFVAVGGIVTITSFRKKLPTHVKVLCLISAYTIGGFAGFYTLGLYAGTVFIFPTTAVVMAIFYPMCVTLTYIFCALLLCILIAIRFCSGQVALDYGHVQLMQNYFHWFVYIICIGFFFAVAFVTIHNYRSAMRKLIHGAMHQRDQLAKANEELVAASQNVKILKGMLPICASCKKIRDDKGYWNQIELYIEEHSEADFSHGLCPNCKEKLYPDLHQPPNLDLPLKK